MKVNGKKKLHGLEVWNKRLENTSYRTYFEKIFNYFMVVLNIIYIFVPVSL